MKPGRYRRAALAGVFGLMMCFISWLLPGSFIVDFSMLAVFFGAMVSGNAHAPSEAATYLAMWAQWSLIGYGVATVFFTQPAQEQG